MLWIREEVWQRPARWWERLTLDSEGQRQRARPKAMKGPQSLLHITLTACTSWRLAAWMTAGGLQENAWYSRAAVRLSSGQRLGQGGWVTHWHESHQHIVSILRAEFG
nr:hypothetical protein L203_02369 [Cryptococcus depauperatus CBS 7841]